MNTSLAEKIFVRVGFIVLFPIIAPLIVAILFVAVPFVGLKIGDKKY